MEEQKRSFFCLIVIIFSAAADAADEVRGNLTGKVGGNVTLPDAVLELGLLLKDGKTLAMVNSRELLILEQIYKERLLWDKSSGHFTLTGLKKNDSGKYTIDSKKGSVFFVTYKLAVYDAAPTPKVVLLEVSTESCSMLCSVDTADEETTLLWYKDQQIHTHNRSAISSSLTLNMKQDLNSSFSCVAKNPAEKKAVLVNVLSICGKSKTNNNATKGQRNYLSPVIASSIACVVFIIISVACVIKSRYFHHIRAPAGQTEETEPEVQYAEVHIIPDRRSKGGNLPESQESVDQSNLRTVYDQLEVHRMVSTDPAEPV